MRLFFPYVWLATEKLMNNQTRLLNFSDRGSLHFEPGLLLFSGQKQSLQMKNIKKIDLKFARIPWISTIISLTAFVAFVIFMFAMAFESIERIIVVLPFLIFLIPVVIFAQKASLWIEITFADDENVLHRAYFLDGSRLHLNTIGSMLEDTLKMYKELKAAQ